VCAPSPPGNAKRTRWRARAAPAWPLVQGTAAATVAWAIALQIGGGHDPFFAPIAAFIALNAPFGERGLNALRLLLGVVVGIVCGELTVLLLGSGYGSLALATLTATLGATVLGGSRITVAQAAVGAILVVAIANGEAGLYRLADALIGAGVALVFSQFLFSPEPVALLRRAETAVLTDLADALALTARALVDDDAELDGQAVAGMRDLRDRLVELSRARRVGERVARRSVMWRSQRAPVARERENAAHLDLLGGSCLMLTRTSINARSTGRRRLSLVAGELADAVAGVADRPGDPDARQRLADRALGIARRLGRYDDSGDEAQIAAVAAGRVVAADLMIFAGVDPDEAVAAVRERARRPEVPAPPRAPRAPLHLGARGARLLSALRRRSPGGDR
jgi:Fusaric acid resistance protein-like